MIGWCAVGHYIALHGYVPVIRYDILPDVLPIYCICNAIMSYPIMGQSHDFWRANSLFVARVASFGLERSEGENDATRDTNKLYARQKSFDYHYYQYTRPNHKIHLIRKKLSLEM